MSVELPQGLDPGAVGLARAVAVLGAGVELAHARRLASLDHDGAARACDALVSSGILAPGRPLSFADPELGRSIYESIGDAERRASHTRAARILEELGAGPETVADQLLQAEPDGRPPAVEALREAARIARARGAHGLAAQRLRRALAEPPMPFLRPALELELADAELAARIESPAPTGPTHPPVRARLLERARVLDGPATPADAGDCAVLAELAVEAFRDGSRPADGVAELAERALSGVLDSPELTRALGAIVQLCHGFPPTDGDPGIGDENPFNPAAGEWRSERALAALRAGDQVGASAAARAQLVLARAFGAPRAIGVAARCASICAQQPDHALLTESEALLRGSDGGPELARTLLELGSVLRRAGERAAARTPLREAQTLAKRLGDDALARRATDELAATGARRLHRGLSGLESLTPSERRVAELAATGLTNREIAQELVVAQRTVTTHLTHIYQKLGVDDRHALADALETGGD